MKIILLAASLMLVFCGCGYLSKYDKPHLELSGNNPYTLQITEFTWGYGMTSINEFNGDFDKLDARVFDLLKGKEGNCKVYIENKQTDKYGKENSTSEYVGDIDLLELNKYQTWEFWHKASGIKSLLYKKYVAPKAELTVADSAKMDSLPMDTVSLQPPASTEKELQTYRSKTYKFDYETLYPMPEDRNFNDNQATISGVILDANFMNGVMTVKNANDEVETVQFYPLNSSSRTFNQLRLAIKPGNRIEGIVARAGASTVDLVLANITEQ